MSVYETMATTSDTREHCRETASPAAKDRKPAVQDGPDFQQVFESIPGLYLVLDPELRIVSATDAYARTVMIGRDMLVGKMIFDVFSGSPDDSHSAGVKSLAASLRRVLQKRTGDATAVQKFDVRRPPEKGGGFEERHWSTLNSPVLAPDGSVAWIIHGVEDVTELVRAAAEGRDTGHLNGSLPQAQRLTLQLMSEAVADRRQSEEVALELRERTAELKEAQRLAHLGDWSWDAKTGALTGSDELLRIFGLDPASEHLPSYADQKGRLFSADAWERLNAVAQAALHAGASYELDVEALCRGNPIWVTARGEVVHDARGDVVGLRGTVQEITERKRAEKKLRESEERERARAAELAALLDVIPAPVFFAYDPECQHITGNRAADELLRHPRGAEASLSATDERRPRHFRAFKDGRALRNDELPAQRAARGEHVQDFEFSLVFDDGMIRDVLAYGTPLKDDDGALRGSVLVLIDITERKAAQVALQAREQQLRSFVEQAPAAMAMFDRNMNYVAASQQWTREYGRGHLDLVGKNLYSVHTDLPERWREIHRRGLAGEHQAKDEDIWNLADGSRRWLRWSVGPWLDARGDIGGILILAENISARKEAEEALRKTEKRLRLVLEATEIGTFEIDFASGTAHWNAIEFELLGLRPGEVSAGPETFFRYVHPADREPLRLEWEEAMRNGELNAEFRVVRADGQERWLAGKGRFVIDETEVTGATAAVGATKKPARFLGVNFDITERKEAEQALAESQQRFAGIVGSAMDAIVSVDAEQKIILFNAAAEKMFGCPVSVAIGSSVERFIPERFRAAHAEHIRQFAQTGLASRSMGRMGSLTGLRANGVEFPIEASISKIEVGGQLLATVILRDISERRRLEQEVLEISAREQRRIGRELHDDVCQWLAGTELLTSALAKSLSTETPRLAARAEKIVESIRQALARARVLAHGLEPSVIQSEGLVGALRELAMNAAEMFHVRCQYDGPARVDVRDEVAALHLYRIAQEAIANAVRHGGAREIQIVLQIEPERASMLIRDDGSGIALPLPPTSGMGLRNMRYRAGIIGATLDVRRASTGGTEIVCTFPRAL